MDDAHCYRVASSRDGRFDGAFVTAVTSTGVYCRPSCPARTPKRENVRFYPTPAAAQEAGFRACKRCRPDAAPGSPEWDLRADLVARTVRLIGDGVVEREGVGGLARRVGYSTRQLHRLVFAELGTGPLRLALAHRVQSARALLETTDLSITDVAWAAGFGSIRQFNDRIRDVYGLSPGDLRRMAARSPAAGRARLPGWIPLRLSYRPPLSLRALLEFLGARAVPGTESWDGTTYSRVLRLPRAKGVVSISATSGAEDRRAGTTAAGRSFVECELRLEDVRDFAAAVARVRRLLDLDADPAAVHAALADDPVVGPLASADPGLRVPGSADAEELAMRAVIGQQVSVAAARSLAGRLAAQLGEPMAPRGDSPEGLGPHLAFPAADVVAACDPGALPMPASRARALCALACSLADGVLHLDPGSDRDESERRLLSIRGVGAWTASYVRMRGLGDPDVFLASDLAVRRALAASGSSTDPAAWKPWRSYATVHLWSSRARRRVARTR